MLNNVTLPKSVGPHFPADLNTANQVTNDVISILRESIMDSVPLSLNMVNEFTGSSSLILVLFSPVLSVCNIENWEQGLGNQRM